MHYCYYYYLLNTNAPPRDKVSTFYMAAMCEQRTLYFWLNQIAVGFVVPISFGRSILIAKHLLTFYWISLRHLIDFKYKWQLCWVASIEPHQFSPVDKLIKYDPGASIDKFTVAFTWNTLLSSSLVWFLVLSVHFVTRLKNAIQQSNNQHSKST